MGNNLPPGVTPGDIDRHFGEPDRQCVTGTVHVSVTVKVPTGWSEREIKAELLDTAADGDFEQALYAEIEQVTDD